MVGGREFLKGQEKYRPYHDLGNPQFRRVASEPTKAIEVVKALHMVISPSSELDGFLLVLRRRMGWPLRQIVHPPLATPDRPTAADWPRVYATALNNTPKVRPLPRAAALAGDVADMCAALVSSAQVRGDWEFYKGVLEMARDQRRAFGLDKYHSQLEEIGALQHELVRKCDSPTSGSLLKCMLETFDRCVVPEGRKAAEVRSCGALLRAFGDGDSSFNSIT